MSKKGLLLCSIISITALYGLSHVTYKKHNKLMTEMTSGINNTGYFIVKKQPQLELNMSGIKNTTHIKDKFGYDWILETNTDYLDIFNDIESITRLYSGSDETNKQYEDYLTDNHSLPLIIYSKVSNDNLHIEASSQPIKIKSSTSSINIPELQIIHYSDSKKQETVLLATSDITINHNGATTIYKKPRFLYSLPTNSASEISFKVDKVSVGNVSVADSVHATFSHTQNNSGNLDVSIKANFNNLSSVGDGNLTFDLRNISKNTLLDSINYAVEIALSGQDNDKNIDHTDELITLMNFARNDGSATFNFNAKKQGYIVEIETSLRFDPILRNAINEHNALSIIQAANLEAKLNIPSTLASSFISKVWLNRFVDDQMILVDKQQLRTDVKLNKMNATINGVKLKI